MGISTLFHLTEHRVRWARMLSQFLGVQLIVQAIGILSGLLLVRLLSKQDYAFFTIANSMLGIMTVLSDNGISSGLTAIGGRVHADRQQFGQLVNTALGLRKTLGTWALLIVSPALIWLLIRNGASLLTVIPLTGAVLVSFWLQMGLGVLAVIPRLALQTRRVQNLDLVSAGMRLALLAIAAMTFLNATVAVFVAGVCLLIQLWMLERWIPELVDRHAPKNPQFQAEILTVVKQQTPNTLYFCIQGQISLWLISIFGNTQSVAEIGALGRLAVIFVIVTSVVNALIVPRFARLRDPNQLRRIYGMAIVGLLGFGLLLVLATLLCPTPILWLLGAKYAGLDHQLFLSVLGGVLGAVIGSMYSLNASRGWITPFSLGISSGIILQIALISFLDISSVSGVLWLGILTTPLGFVLCLFTAWQGFKRDEL